MENTEQDKKITNEDLARMVQNGFMEVTKIITEMKSDIKSLQAGQEDIKAVLANVAAKSEVAETKERVTDLEIQFRRLKPAVV